MEPYKKPCHHVIVYVSQKVIQVWNNIWQRINEEMFIFGWPISFFFNLLAQKPSSKQENSLNMWTALKFQSAVVMFEWKDIYVASLVSVTERWQLQQKRRSHEVTGLERECLSQLEWNLQQVCAMWQGVRANDIQHRSVNTAEQCRCHKRVANSFTGGEMLNSWNWHLDSFSLETYELSHPMDDFEGICCRSQWSKHDIKESTISKNLLH